MRGTVIKKNLKKFRKARTFMCLYENKERKKEMKDKLKKILDEAMAQIDSSDRLDRLNEIKVSFLGKKGELTSVLKAMKDVAQSVLLYTISYKNQIIFLYSAIFLP